MIQCIVVKFYHHLTDEKKHSEISKITKFSCAKCCKARKTRTFLDFVSICIRGLRAEIVTIFGLLF